jgi:tetratricopeptide (TPR) repeat protein
MGNYDQAIADLTQAIRLDPNMPEGYFCRGMAYYNKKDYNRSIADFEAALRLNPNDSDTKEWLDKARQERGR